MKVAELWLEPLYERIRCQLVSETFIHADETPVTVLDKTLKESGKKTYMWVYGSGELSPYPIALYDHRISRSGNGPKEFLNGFTGYLQTDDFGGYNKVQNVIRVGCLAHARRYFHDAFELAKKEAPIEGTRAAEALKLIGKLFEHEATYIEDGLSAQERYEKRLKVSKPDLEAYFVWLKKNEAVTLPKSLLGRAIAYSLSNWDLLSNYLLDGQCSISNNHAERLVKPFVISRKNFLFYKSVQGAKSSSIYFSLIQTARMNGLNPYAYLKHILEKLPNIALTSNDALDHLLPWNDQIKSICSLSE